MALWAYRRMRRTLAARTVSASTDNASSSLLPTPSDAAGVANQGMTYPLDPSARRQAWEVIAGLRALGRTIFLTTHYMDEAEHVADRIIVIANGIIVAEGTPRTLAGHDKRPASITFTLPGGIALGALPSALAGHAIRATNGAVHLASTRPLADLALLASWADERSIELPDLGVKQPALEDIYLELTERRSA